MPRQTASKRDTKRGGGRAASSPRGQGGREAAGSAPSQKSQRTQRSQSAKKPEKPAKPQRAQRSSGAARATIDHDEIRRWVEEHGGRPAQVMRTGGKGQTGILRIDFPGFSGAGSLAPIAWDEFFQKFDESNLAFLYQDQTKSGRPSRFNKLVGRESLSGLGEGARPSKEAQARDPGTQARGGRVRGRRALRVMGKDEGLPPPGGRTQGRKAQVQARGKSVAPEIEAKGQGKPAEGGNAVELLKRQHADVHRLFDEVHGGNKRARQKIFDQILTALALHLDIEEQVFYPALKKRQTASLLRRSAEEHLACKRVLADLIDTDAGDERWHAKVEVLRRLVDRHIEEEESETFPLAQQVLGAGKLAELGQAMEKLAREELAEGGIRARVVEHTEEAAPI